jgi:tripartite ATP-independent transporter DctM subunit
MLLGLSLGLPVAFVLGGVAIVFSFFLWGPTSLLNVPLTTVDLMKTIVLVPIPLFVFMAVVLERSGIVDDLYEMMYRWAGPIRGGLAMGTVLIATVFAAMSGIVGAGTVTMGLIALPSMLKRGYNKGIAIGCVCAGGALGQLIPPSVDMILYGFIAKESVGKLFAGGLIPGLILSSLFITYIAIRCAIQPNMGPALPPEERATWGEKFASIRAVLLPMLLVIGVLGSIFAGLATPTEASAVGATGALICAAVYRRLNWDNLKDAAFRTLRVTSMCLWIVLGATIFTAVYQALGATELLKEVLSGMPGGRWGVMITIQLTFFIMGCFIDDVAIMMIAAPIFLPVIKAFGFDPVWFGVLFIVNMQMGFLTPPYGFTLFYIKGVAPKGVTMGDIYRSIWPFVLLQGLGLIIVILLPEVVLWIPNLIFG